jgi:uncharacterized membrane protein YraQ (UPF0718 family)
LFFPQSNALHHFVYAEIEILRTMWWGVLVGMFFVGIMHKIPREYFTRVLGKSDTLTGIARATFAGVVFDVCSHGIVLIAAKLYERGVSLPQVMAFLIASPWNSISLTLVLIAMIGWQWTLAYIIGSIIIAFITGIIFKILIKNGNLPANPYTLVPMAAESDNAPVSPLSFRYYTDIVRHGVAESRMLVRWLLLGVIIAAAVRAFIPADIFADWFGPTIIGLLVTLVVATIIEVCSEGAVPLASEIFHRAGAAGNGFTLLMAGVSTDYTEIAVVREFTKSWKIALMIPLITVPQIVFIGWLMNKVVL